MKIFDPASQTSFMSKEFILVVVAIGLTFPITLPAQTREDDYKTAKAGVMTAASKMEAAYSKLIADIRVKNDKGIADELVKSLEKSQKAWLTYRDDQVKFVVKYYPVSHPFIRETYQAIYNTALIEARTQDLVEVPNPR